MITLPAFTPRLMTTIASITAVREVFLLQLSQLEGMQKNITTVGVLQRTCRLIGSRCFVSDGTFMTCQPRLTGLSEYRQSNEDRSIRVRECCSRMYPREYLAVRRSPLAC